MATKKQKREAALAKREKFLKDEKARGLHAQEMDKQWQAAENQAEIESDRVLENYERAVRFAEAAYIGGSEEEK